MVNVNLILVIVGGFTFLGANRKLLNTLLLITYDLFLMKIANLMLVIVGDVSFSKEIANLMLVIVGGVSRFLMEIANCYRRYCFV